MNLSIDYVRISCIIKSIMCDYNYEIIKASVLEWYERVLSDCPSQDEIMLSKNKEDALIIDFDFKNCMAQFSVTNSL